MYAPVSTTLFYLLWISLLFTKTLQSREGEREKKYKNSKLPSQTPAQSHPSTPELLAAALINKREEVNSLAAKKLGGREGKVYCHISHNASSEGHAPKKFISYS
jgi:hypothetical protein